MQRSDEILGRVLDCVEVASMLVAELVRKTVPALNCGKNLLVEAVVCPTEIIDLRARDQGE